MRDSSIIFATRSPAWLIVLLGIALVALLAWLYGKERRLVSRRLGVLLTVLRAVAAVLLVMMLLEPLSRVRWTDTLQGMVAVVIDTSQSMGIKDERREGYEKVRCAEALGFLRKGVRDTSMQELASRAERALARLDKQRENAKALAAIAEGGASAGDLDDAQRQVSREHSKLQSSVQQIFRQVTTALREAKEHDLAPTTVDGLRKQQAQLSQTLNSDLSRLTKLTDDLRRADDARSVGTLLALYHQLLAGVDAVFRNAHKAFVSLQQTQDNRLAASDKEEVRAAITKLDKMTRNELARELLASRKVDLLDELRDRFRVTVYQGDVRAKEVNAEQLATVAVSDAVATDLNACLETVVAQLKDELVAGLVLITDGQHNEGKDPEVLAKALGARQIPVHSIGLGSERPPKDIAIAKVETSGVVFYEDEVHVDVSLKADGYDGLKIPVVVTQAGKEVAREEVLLADDLRRQNVQLSFPAKEKGQVGYVIQVPGQSDETVSDNNQKDFQIEVLKDKMKVLLIEGEPRWEFRFLKNALLRDKRVDLSFVLVDRDASVLPRGDGMNVFPNSRDRLLQFDVLILGDVNQKLFRPTELHDLAQFVADKGGTIVVMAGEYFMPATYRETEIEELLPVVTPSAPAALAQVQARRKEGFRMVLTPEGTEDPIARLSLDRLENGKIWQYLPKMYWHAGIRSAKPGATIVAHAATGRAAADGKQSEPHVLMAYHAYGVGKVFFIGVDETWRWRYKVGDRFFHRFWGQLLRWATSGKLAGRDKYVRIGTHKSTYRAAEPVLLQAEVRGKDLKPLRDGLVSAALAKDGETKDHVTLEYVPDSEGRYRGKLLGLQEGNYSVRLLVPDLSKDPSEAEVAFEVKDELHDEHVDLHMNRGLLEKIAEESSGRFYTVETASLLPESIEEKSREIPRTAEVELWNSGYLMALFAILLIAEWTIRKLTGLL